MKQGDTETTDEAFEALLRYMRDSRGFDFTGYKRTSLMRRVRHRMDHAGYDTYEQYLDVLQASSDEFSALFNTILINVTAFFRDPDAWEYIRTDVIPQMLAERGPDDPIRVWSAGCASGQEAYTLAILLAEALGPDAFRQRVKIYATDIDEEALTEARAASYDERAVESVPPDLLARYFEQLNGRYVFHKDLRRAVIFGRNDLVKDAPISRVDLLVCRNSLMYLNAETQRNVLGRLHFALAAQGTLFLGHAEMLLSHADRFTPLNLKHRVFRKAAGSHTGLERYDPAASMYDRHGELPGLTTVRELAFRASPVAQIVVTGEDTVAMINQQAESIFGLSARDIGRLLRDLEVSYRPVELRAYIEQAKVERRSARIQEVKWQRPGSETVWFEIHVNPLVDADNGLLGVSIVFFDVTATRALVDKVVQTNRQLEAAYEELQSTNEELETTNEELQSTVEELETTNEELQSTNEELETMNEELQSTNDELHTINDTLRERSIELDDARTFLDSLVNSIHLGMVVVDREMRVVVWNRYCEELWGLRADETAGVPLTSLDINLPLDTVRPLIGNAFVDSDQTGEVVVDAVNRRGRATRIRLTCTAFRSQEGTVKGALLLMEDQA
ncbi:MULTISPECIES: CheR family methyltransferase [Mycolicibacterium]|uniref:protein-glutamate O-methyltransferase n=1 Tax=Mycolicibacterium senegalense TaxID=1796 RepID=A0A378SYS8_9MYCO|nr:MULTISPECIES: CheR family methyltransferase [Mycolicibacterium]MCV7334115.1 PAS domain S-box protein [Mycolicibacterium senegalense]MDR7292167.1 two-component system CheB/CheR fusion protein [Mycolicibacterium senegalense]QZA23567.1 PAS domain S-box protein [Mycolicibacterium senegalense]CDP88615.1 chemotaxis protein CheR [Mycolicibacterium farcinogenes]STZ52801.1 chemotaxis protein CheR [Mycolicibacterium senegalense]